MNVFSLNPRETRVNKFNNGISIELKNLIFFGGHNISIPISYLEKLMYERKSKKKKKYKKY